MLNEINLVINVCQVRDMIMMFYFEFSSLFPPYLKNTIINVIFTSEKCEIGYIFR